MVAAILGILVHTLKQFFASCPLPLLDAKMLVEKELHVSRAWMIAHDTDSIDPDQWQKLQQSVQRRLNGEPMAYIMGSREFMGLDFTVSPSVLIPRPDTETLVETALDFLKGKKARVLDLGTGSGAIAVSIAYYHPDAEVCASDIHPDALNIAKENTEKFKLKINFQQSNWFEKWEGQYFDLIVSNPPYIHKKDAHLQQGDLRFEPQIALTDFHDGLTCYRTIIAQAPHHLKPEGALFVEHGWDQAASVRELLEKAGFRNIHSIKDLSGIERVTGGNIC